MNIVVTGSIAYDYIMHFPGHFTDHILPESLDNLTLSFHVQDMSKHWGGTGANIAYTLALLGERPRLVGAVGADFEEYRDWLNEAGVDTSHVREFEDVFTASFFANIDEANRQLGFFYSGAMERASEVTLENTGNGEADLVTISASHPEAMTGYVRECKELNIPYHFDPSQQVIWLDPDGLRESTIGARLLTLNDYEYDLLLKKTGLSNQDVLAGVEMVVVTKGEKGARILHDGQEVQIPPAPPTEVVDPTGAGDAFRGGFLKGLAQGWSLELTGRVGALAATYTIEGSGPQSPRYTPKEFVQRFRKSFPDFDDKGALDSME